ncbi:MAG TPA: lasso peptide biosynthesis B2 protein [Candidatus Angelobacter sp.]|nr:lasso peptide biosynthesis B2 protein [Candidatus Angelobacter sp.]
MIATNDGAALLDVDQGVCFGLTPVGILIWDQLKLNRKEEEILQHLAHEFPNISQIQLQSDLFEFIASLRNHGLLINAGPRSMQPIPGLLRLLQSHKTFSDDLDKRWLTYKALIGLLVFDVVHNGNFGHIHNCVQQWPVASRPHSSDLVDQVCRAINLACIWYPKRVMCLQRSAVMTCLLRNYGISAQMVLGAQKFPFKAHAWTEVGGLPVNERSDVQRRYLVWGKC